MNPNYLDSRCVFYDGPVTVFLHHDTETSILEAYERIRRLVQVAACQMAAEVLTTEIEKAPNDTHG